MSVLGGAVVTTTGATDTADTEVPGVWRVWEMTVSIRSLTVMGMLFALHVLATPTGTGAPTCLAFGGAPTGSPVSSADMVAELS